MSQVHVFGGSNGYGYWDSPDNNGWPNRLSTIMRKRTLNGKQSAEIINYSRSGMLLPEILGLLPAAVLAHKRGQQIGVFEIGRTEAGIAPGEDLPRVPLEDFREQLMVLGKMCVDLTLHPIFIGSPRIDEKKNYSLP